MNQLQTRMLLSHNTFVKTKIFTTTKKKYKPMNIRLILTILIFVFTYAAKAQSVKEVNYEHFKPYLSKQTDTVYVINFWATWCKPCIEELPHFMTVAQDMRQKPVKFTFVSLDFPKYKESKLLPFIRDNVIDEEVILLNDPNSNYWINDINKEWSGAIPATIIYKKDKRSFFEGQVSYEKLLESIEEKL